jgi:hypothetical protein
MKSLRNLIILSILLFTACMDPIELSVDTFEPMVVVEGEINDLDEFQELKLSISQPYFQEGQKFHIENALVELYENGSKVGAYQTTRDGTYLLEFKGEIRKEYRVEITLPEIPEFPQFSGRHVSSEVEKLNPVSEITAIRYEYKPESLIFEEGYYLLINTYDPKGLGNYYRWKLEVNGKVSKDPRHIMIVDDARLDGNVIEDLDLTLEPLHSGDKVTVFQQSISNKHFQFLYDIYMQALTQEGFFDSPAYNPNSNLKADIPVVGYFNASSYELASIEIEE